LTVFDWSKFQQFTSKIFCWISGLGLGSILSKLRNSANDQVQIQVEVFDEKLHRDQADLEKDPFLNLSPQQLFDIIHTKVREMSVWCSSSASSSGAGLSPVDSTHTGELEWNSTLTAPPTGSFGSLALVP
jgi:hypothetical protein